jgi:hypothetical protein
MSLRYLDLHDSYTTIVRTGLWELSREFAVAGEAISNIGAGVSSPANSADQPTEDFFPNTLLTYAVSPSSNTSAYVVPLAATRSLSILPEFKFLLSNAADSVATAWAAAIDAGAEAAAFSCTYIGGIQIGVLIIHIVTPILLLMMLIRPLLVRVAGERLAMFRVFIRIPPEVVVRLARLPINVGEVGEEDDSSDEDEGDDIQNDNKRQSTGNTQPAKEATTTAQPGKPKYAIAIPPPAARASSLNTGTGTPSKPSLKVIAQSINFRMATRRVNNRSSAETFTKAVQSVRNIFRFSAKTKPQTESMKNIKSRSAASLRNHALTLRGSSKVIPASGGDTSPASGAAPAAKQNQPFGAAARRFLRMITPSRITLSLLSVAVLLLVFFLCSFLLVRSSRITTANLKIAGTRSVLAARVQFFSQELVAASCAKVHGNASIVDSITVAGTNLGPHFRADIADVPFNRSLIGLASTNDPHFYKSYGSGAVLVGATGSRSLDDYIKYAAAGLENAAHHLQRYHAALLYGDPQLSVESSIYTSQSQTDILFNPGCMRVNVQCVPSTHPYYQITTSGLHRLVEYVVQEALQLSNMSVSAIAQDCNQPGSSPLGISAVLGTTGLSSGLRNPRHEFLWSVSETDLRDGLGSSMAVYEKESLAYSMGFSIANGIIFSVFIVAVAAVYWGLFRPYITQIQSESHRAASLLRSLPGDIDLETLQGSQKGATEDDSSPVSDANARK